MRRGTKGAGPALEKGAVVDDDGRMAYVSEKGPSFLLGGGGLGLEQAEQQGVRGGGQRGRGRST